MADHVRTLRKRLERMERAGVQNTGRPVNQRDQALVEALRAGIAALEKSGDAPRFVGKHPALGAPYGGVVKGMVVNMPQIDADFARKYDNACWEGVYGKNLPTDDAVYEVKARILHQMILERVTEKKPCEHAWRCVPGTRGLVDQCEKCGEERA